MWHIYIIFLSTFEYVHSKHIQYNKIAERRNSNWQNGNIHRKFHYGLWVNLMKHECVTFKI